jgi:hypothetical protein
MDRRCSTNEEDYIYIYIIVKGILKEIDDMGYTVVNGRIRLTNVKN